MTELETNVLQESFRLGQTEEEVHRLQEMAMSNAVKEYWQSATNPISEGKLSLQEKIQDIIDDNIIAEWGEGEDAAALVGEHLFVKESDIPAFIKSIIDATEYLRRSVGRSGEDYLLEIDRKDRHIAALKKEIEDLKPDIGKDFSSY